MEGKPRADNFSTVEIDLGDRPAFDANAYSFFGDMTNDDVSALGLEGGLDALEGALEVGLEAPPEESVLEDAGLYDDLPRNLDVDDLSLATMLLNQARLRDQESDLSTFTLEPPSSMQQQPPEPQVGAQAPTMQQQLPRTMMNAADLEAQMFSQAAQQQQSHELLRMGPAPPGQQPLSPLFSQQQQQQGMPGGPFQFSMPPPHQGGAPHPPPGMYPAHPGMPPPPYPPQMHNQPPPHFVGMPPGMVPPPYPGSPGPMRPPGPPPPPGMMHGGPPPPHFFNSMMPPPSYGPLGGPPPGGPPLFPHPGGGPAYPPRPPPSPGMGMPPGPPPPPRPMHGGISSSQLEARLLSQAAMQQQQATGGQPAWDTTSQSGAGMSLAEIMRQQQVDSAASGQQHNWQQQQQQQQLMHQSQFPGGGHPMPQQQVQGPYGPRTSGSGTGAPYGRGPGSQQHRYSSSGSVRGRRAGGKYMSAEEVEHIMHIMYAAVHNGHPYAEDYYYQAVVNAHCLGRNDAMFEPQELRDLAEGVARLDPSASVKFVPGIEGLGKIVYSNLRTPRVLLDFSAVAATATADAAAPASTTTTHRPLNQEPLLAARIMIEDCLNLLLDVDDIDRIFKSAAAKGAGAGMMPPPPPAVNADGKAAHPLRMPEAAEDLLQRRALLLAGITSSFRLPTTPTIPPSDGGSPSPMPASGDGIFHRVMVLAKGRNVLARTLRVLAPPPLPPLPNGAQRPLPSVPHLDPIHLLWASLRGAVLLFGASPAAAGLDASADRALVESSARVAVGAITAIDKLQDPSAVTGCLEALCAGLQPPPSPPTGAAGRLAATTSAVLPLVKVSASSSGQQQQQQPVWLGEVVTRLLRKGEELGFRIGGSDSGETAARWRSTLPLLVSAVARHLEALQAVHAAASAASNPDALRAVSALVARPVVAVVAEQASDEARAQLRSLVSAFIA